MAIPLTLIAAPSAGQVVVVKNAVTCDACRISLHRDLTLGSPDGPEALGGAPIAISETNDGRLLVVDPFDRDRIRTYASDGAFTGFIGQSGGGPGEFSGIALVRAGERYLHVFDRGNGRYSLLTLTGEYVSSGAAHPFFTGVHIGGDQILLNADINTRDRIGYPLHIINSDGAVQLSFGAEVPAFRPDLPWLRMRALAPSEHGVWSAHQTRYELELWSSSGVLARKVRREAAWFQGYENWEPIDPTTAPRPWLQAIHLDELGRLWVAVHVADANWRSAFGRNVTGPHGPAPEIEPTRLWDTVIEVLDSSTGSVLARQRIPDQALFFLESGRVVTARSGEGGVPLIDIWTLELTTSR